MLSPQTAASKDLVSPAIPGPCGAVRPGNATSRRRGAQKKDSRRRADKRKSDSNISRRGFEVGAGK